MADTTTAAGTDSLSPGIRRTYAMGGLSSGTFGTVPGLLLLPYLTDRLGLAAGIAGLIVFLPKAWDFFMNPIAGRISDRSTSPKGRRRPFVLWGGLALAVAFAAIFAGPTTPQGLAVAWVLVTFIAGATAYSFFQVPFIAMAAEMTTTYAERTRLMTWRVAILALAILISGGLSPALRDAGGETWGYRAVGVFVGLLILLGTYAAWRGTAGVPLREVPAPSAGLREQLRLVAARRDFRLLLTTFVLQALATGCMLAGVDYVARWVIGREGAATILFICFVGPALVVTPLWQMIGARVGKRTGYLAASALLLLGALAVYAARGPALLPLALAVAVVGVGYAGAQMFPMAMLPDVAAVDAARTGQNRIGVFTGVWTGAETLGLALGPGLYAAVLAWGGYAASAGGEVAQSARAVDAIHLGFSLVPAVIVAVSLVVIARYNLDEQTVRASTASLRHDRIPDRERGRAPRTERP